MNFLLAEVLLLLQSLRLLLQLLLLLLSREQAGLGCTYS